MGKNADKIPAFFLQNSHIHLNACRTENLRPFAGYQRIGIQSTDDDSLDTACLLYTSKGESLETCAKKAVAFLREGIQQAVEEGTDPNEGICFEPYLYKLWEKKEDLK